MIKNIYNYVDFKSINSSVKYLSISAFLTGIALGYFFTVIVITQKLSGYLDYHWLDQIIIDGTGKVSKYLNREFYV